MAAQTMTPGTRAEPKPAHPGRRRFRPRMALALVVALAIAVLGAGELAAMLRARSAPLATDNYELGGLTLRINKVNWVQFDMGDPTDVDPTAKGGYQMPSQMMPGMPTDGQGRLNLEITLTDDGDQARAMDATSEFFVGGGGMDHKFPPKGDTFGGLKRVNPNNAVNGKLYFDFKPPGRNAPPLYLEWQRDDDMVRLLLVPGGSVSVHHHH